MKITSVNVTPFEAPIPGGTVRAFAEVELDGEVLLRGIQVVETEKGGAVSILPDRRLARGPSRNDRFPGQRPERGRPPGGLGCVEGRRQINRESLSSWGEVF